MVFTSTASMTYSWSRESLVPLLTLWIENSDSVRFYCSESVYTLPTPCFNKSGFRIELFDLHLVLAVQEAQLDQILHQPQASQVNPE